MKKLPKNYNLHKGYVLVEVFEKSTFDETLGIEKPAYEKDTHEQEVTIVDIGGSFLQRLVTKMSYRIKKGDKAIINRSIDNIMELEGRKFKVVFVEDIKISWHEQENIDSDRYLDGTVVLDGSLFQE